jgi:hypothetical protein
VINCRSALGLIKYKKERSVPGKIRIFSNLQYPTNVSILPSIADPDSDPDWHESSRYHFSESGSAFKAYNGSCEACGFGSNSELLPWTKAVLKNGLKDFKMRKRKSLCIC